MTHTFNTGANEYTEIIGTSGKAACIRPVTELMLHRNVGWAGLKCTLDVLFMHTFALCERVYWMTTSQLGEIGNNFSKIQQLLS